MLRTTKGILRASHPRPERIAAANATAFQPPYPWESPAPRRGMDRKNCRYFTCKGVPLLGIKEHKLTCRGGLETRPYFSFPDAEPVQCMDKGGAPFFGRGHRLARAHLGESSFARTKPAPAPYPIGKKTGDLVFCSWTGSVEEGGKVGSYRQEAAFSGRRPNAGGGMSNRAACTECPGQVPSLGASQDSHSLVCGRRGRERISV